MEEKQKWMRALSDTANGSVKGKERIMLESMIYSEMQFHRDGQIAIALVTKDMIARSGANTVILNVNDRAVKVFGNGMVDINDFVDFDAKEELGINEMVRFSVGIEHVQDIIADLEQALEKI